VTPTRVRSISRYSAPRARRPAIWSLRAMSMKLPRMERSRSRPREGRLAAVEAGDDVALVGHPLVGEVGAGGGGDDRAVWAGVNVEDDGIFFLASKARGRTTAA